MSMLARSSLGLPTLRFALFLGCGAGAAAERAMPTFDDGLSLLQMSRKDSNTVPLVSAGVYLVLSLGSRCSDLGYADIASAAECFNDAKTALGGTGPTATINSPAGPHGCWRTTTNGYHWNTATTGTHPFYGLQNVCKQPPTPAPTQEACVDLNGSAADSAGYTCATLDYIPSGCGLFDDHDFTGNILCCYCGGGDRAAAHTPAPTAPAGEPSTPAPTQEASATGDPHVTNVDGARFNIMRAGVHEFLRLPRRANGSGGSEEPEPLLSVSAMVERADEEGCRESYLKQVDVTGGWLNSSGPLRFRTGGDNLDGARAIALWVNGSLVDKEVLVRNSKKWPFLEVMEPRSQHIKTSSNTIQKVPMLTVKLNFAIATLQIDWVHRTVPGRLSLNHMNFQAFGLRRFVEETGMDIGGILGRDDHSDATSLPQDCKPVDSDLRVLRAGAEEDIQEIAASL